MDSDGELAAFWADLSRDVDDAVTSGEGEAWTPHEFTRQVLEGLGEAGVIENPVPLPSGGVGRFGKLEYEISGFSIPDDDDPERIVIVATLYRGDGPSSALNAGELRNAAVRAARFVLASFKGLHTRIEPANTEASDLARRLLDLKDRIHTVRIAILTDSRTGARSVSETEAGSVRFAVDVYDIERLFRILGKGRTREDIEFDFSSAQPGPIPCLVVPAAGAGYDAYLTALPGNVLADVYDRYGTRLLELNVRAFLGIRGRKTVNAGLRETITKSPDHFLAFNNGIVATVDSIETARQPDGTVTIGRVSGLQIVNGGQTTASLHRARRVDKAMLNAVSVPAKLIHVRGGDLQAMVTSISRSANSQNTVQPADFSANDPFHVRVEALANNTWCADGRTRWFYDRARGSYEVAQERASVSAPLLRKFKAESPKDKRFTKTDLAKYLSAWEGYPHLVCFGGQKNFQSFMQRLKEAGQDAAALDEAWYRRFIAITILFRSAQKTIRRLAFPAYQANIAAYLIAGIGVAAAGRLDFERIWSTQALSDELNVLVESWAKEIDRLLRNSAGQKMPTEWSKKEQCWTDIRARLPVIADPPPEFLAACGIVDADEEQEDAEALGSDELDLVRQAQDVPAPEWQAVAQWGRTTRGIDWRLDSVVRTMAECAAEGWRKKPTPRLAKRALRALMLYREHLSGSANLSS